MTRWCACLVAFAAIACLGPGAPAARAAELRLCLAQAADYSPVHPTTRFPAGSTDELSAVVRLTKGEAYRTLVATWTAVQAVGAQPNHVISRASIPIHRRDRAVIHMRSKAGPLPAGTYRLEVTADGTPWPALDFVVAPVEAPVVRAPADMLPLEPGTVWRYAFEQQFAPGVRPSLPAGTKLDPDGRLRATLEKTAAGTDATGVHIETRRDAVMVEEEWWRLTDAGLVVTKLRTGGEEQTFDPPGARDPAALGVCARRVAEADVPDVGPGAGEGPGRRRTRLHRPDAAAVRAHRAVGGAPVPARHRDGARDRGAGAQRIHADPLGERPRPPAVTARRGRAAG